MPNSPGGKLKFNNFLRTCTECDPAWDCIAVPGYVVKSVKRQTGLPGYDSFRIIPSAFVNAHPT